MLESQGQGDFRPCCEVRNEDKKKAMLSMTFKILAGSTGLEPAASGVTGRRYNRLNYNPRMNNM